MNLYFYRDMMRGLSDQLIEDLLYNHAKKYGFLSCLDFLVVLNNLKIQIVACNLQIAIIEAPYGRLDIQHRIKKAIFYANEGKV